MLHPPLRTILFRLHSALGLTVGFVLALMGATGALMSYEEPLTAWANRDRSAVATRAASPLGPEALIARIEAQLPDVRVRSLSLKDGLVTSARFATSPGNGKSSPAVYVDPYSGDVLGPVRWDEGFATIRALHRWLLIPGDGKGWGRQITGASAMALIAFLTTGLYLRWPRIHRWRIWLQPKLTRPGRARWWSLHTVAGTWLLPVYLVIALSGLTWSYGWFRDGANWLLTGEVSQAITSPVNRPSAHAAIDRAWAAFQIGDGRKAAEASIIVPVEGAFVTRIRWVVDGTDASNLRNEAIFDGATGALLSSRRSADLPLGRRIAGNMFDVHTGRFFGETIRLVFFVAALVMPGFAGTGITLYALRRRASRRGSQRAAVDTGHG